MGVSLGRPGCRALMPPRPPKSAALISIPSWFLYLQKHARQISIAWRLPHPLHGGEYAALCTATILSVSTGQQIPASCQGRQKKPYRLLNSTLVHAPWSQDDSTHRCFGIWRLVQSFRPCAMHASAAKCISPVGALVIEKGKLLQQIARLYSLTEGKPNALIAVRSPCAVPGWSVCPVDLSFQRGTCQA